jgi:hypothetical protein
MFRAQGSTGELLAAPGARTVWIQTGRYGISMLEGGRTAPAIIEP